MNYTKRGLEYPKDRELLLEFLHKASDYFVELVGMTFSEKEIKAFFTDLPPEKTIEDKRFLGIFQNEQMVGVVDYVYGYNTNEKIMLGLFVLIPEVRHTGLAQELQRALEEEWKAQGFVLSRIGVLVKNQQGLQFWKKNGYEQVGDVQKQEHGEVVVLEKRL